jgi:phosphate transport system ATP-binding protein
VEAVAVEGSAPPAAEAEAPELPVPVTADAAAPEPDHLPDEVEPEQPVVVDELEPVDFLRVVEERLAFAPTGEDTAPELPAPPAPLEAEPKSPVDEVPGPSHVRRIDLVAHEHAEAPPPPQERVDVDLAPPSVESVSPSDELTAPFLAVGTPGGNGAAAAVDRPTELARLEARNISAWFGTHNVLDRVSLDMSPGKVTALIGPSGCGKSTFLRILNRMHEMIPGASLAGEVLLDGTDIYDPSRKLTDARRQIGMVFQKPNPFPAMSIYDNVIASFRLTGAKVSHSDKDDVVETCLSKAGLWAEVKDRLRQPGGGLSGGQQQRLCIARALAIQPRVLLMDEPCSALDPTSTYRIEQTIVELRAEVTIVIVTHNMQQAARVSTHCAFFLAQQGTPGVIVEYGDTDAMFHAPQDSRTFDYVNGRFG